MTKILITRPKHQAHKTSKSLNDMGLSTLLEPLLFLETIPHKVDDYSPYKFLIVTSGNSFDFWDFHDIDKTKPLIAVGPQTAQRADECGFTTITDMDGTSADIKAHIGNHKAIHIGGYHISQHLGENVDRLIVYEAHPAEQITTACKDALKKGEISLITFYSTRTAKIFVRLIQNEKLEQTLESIRVLSISHNVLRSVRILPWADMYTASAPNGTAMIKDCERIIRDEYEQA